MIHMHSGRESTEDFTVRRSKQIIATAHLFTCALQLSKKYQEPGQSTRDGVARSRYHHQCYSDATLAQLLAGVGGSILERRYRFHIMKHAEHLIPNGESIFPPTRTAFPNLEE